MQEQERELGLQPPPAMIPTTETTTLTDPIAGTTLSYKQRFGLIPPKTAPGDTRLVFCNVDGIPAALDFNPKVLKVREFLTAIDADIFGCCEVNLNLQALGGQRVLEKWFGSEGQSRLTATYNSHQNIGTHQYGGNMLLTVGEACESVKETGCDPSGLGRWCWTYNKGKNFGTRIICAYRPTPSTVDKHLTVYSQHLQYFSTLGDDCCPRDAFFRDLSTQIQSWQEAGDRIILMADFNEDARAPAFQQRFQGLHLVETVLSRHPNSLAPGSFGRGDRHGTTPIDSIWASPGIAVTAAAYCTSAESPGDHRAIVIDIATPSLVGSPLHRTVRPPSRKLQCSNIHATAWYCESLARYCKTHHIMACIAALQDTTVELNDPGFQRELDELDQCITEGMLTAEATCRTFKMGLLSWSPEYDRARSLVRIWKQLVKKRQGRPIQDHQLRRLADKHGVTLHHNLAEASQLLHGAQVAYARLKPATAVARSSYLQAKMAAPDTTTDACADYQRLLANELSRAHARTMAWVKGKKRSKAISAISVPIADDWEIQTTQAAVEAGISSCMIDRFCLADNCPVRQEPLRSELSTFSSQWNQDILSGQLARPPDISDNTFAFLQQLTKLDIEENDRASISASDFHSFWKRAKERTSSSYSGRHFGHYKAAASHAGLSQLHANFLTLVFSKGYSLSRWQRGVQVILEKKEGLIQVTKLRAILLMEADFNFVNKLLIGRRMMHRVHDTGALPDEIYGGIKHKTATMVAFSRRLLTDISRQLRLPFAIASVDAQACYDRIAHPTAALACQRLGVPPSVTHTMFTTLQQMRFFLRTAYGDSDSYYGGGVQADGRIPQGVCQGNGAGPAIWIAISLVLVRLLQAICIPLRLVSSITKQTWELFGTIYVDDTDLFSMALTTEDTSVPTIQRLHHSVSTWAHGLMTSGGTLMPAKCSWSLLHYKWRGNQCILDPIPPANTAISIPTTDGGSAQLNYLSPHESVELVGVHQSLDGSMKGQLQASLTKANHWAQQLKNHHLDKTDAMKGFRNTIWPSLSYPLLTTTFTAAQGTKLSQALHRAMLPKLVVNRCFPKLLRAAPACLQGLDLSHHYYEQEITHVTALLMYGGDKNTNEGKLLTISLEALQLQIGTATPVLRSDFSRLGCLATPCWLSSVWQFCSKHEIIIDGGPSLPLQRHNDRFLMDIFSDPQYQIPTKQLQAINRVRQHLHLLTLADVYTPDGITLIASFRNGTHRRPLASYYTWPEERPSASDFNSFHQALRRVHDPTIHLLEWISDPHITTRWWLHRPTDILYRLSEVGVWRSHLRQVLSPTLFRTLRMTCLAPLLSELDPVQVTDDVSTT